MSSAPTADEIWKDARWLAQAVDPRAGLVRLVEMTPETYRDASKFQDTLKAFEESKTKLAGLYEHWEEAVELNG